MLMAAAYLGKVGVGVTVPQFFRAQDENVYVVKFQNNRLGSRVLVSEFFAAKFGAIMGLCFPASDIISIDEKILNNNSYLLELGLEPGLHFASRYIEDTEYVRKDKLYKAINVKDMAGVVLFDHMFHNADRAKNPKNLLLHLENEQYKIYAIDNSHLFRSSRWTIDSLQKLGTKIITYYFRYYRKLLNNILFFQDFVPYVNIVRKISNEQIDGIVQEIPQKWLPGEVDRTALSEYAKIRRDMVDLICEELCRLIPRSRGGQK